MRVVIFFFFYSVFCALFLFFFSVPYSAGPEKHADRSLDDISPPSFFCCPVGSFSAVTTGSPVLQDKMSDKHHQNIHKQESTANKCKHGH